MNSGAVVLSCLCLSIIASAPGRDADVPAAAVFTHDVAVLRILEPDPLVAEGIEVVPRAEVVNLGTETERYFDVRFRFGDAYDAVTTVDSIRPGSSVPVSFPPWTTVHGIYTARCSTMLASDSNPDNNWADRVFVVLRPLGLSLEPDTSVRMGPGATRDFLFRLELSGDTAASVSLAESRVPAGWEVGFYDSSGTHEITALGRLQPGRVKTFAVRVSSPAAFRPGTAEPKPETVAVRAFCPADPTVFDDASLRITRVPVGFGVHNFPNPLKDRTTFQVDLPFDATVSLTVYNRAAERVARVLNREELPAGFRFIRWDGVDRRGRAVAPGTYQYLLEYTFRGETGRLESRSIVKALVVSAEQ